MRHRKTNRTLAKTSSVHKLNFALQRNFQLIGSCFKQESPKLGHYESWLLLPWNSISAHITSRHWHYEFSPGSNKMSHSKSLGPSKETYKEATATKQVHLVSNIWNTELDKEKWEKYISHCTFENNSKNTTSDQKNHQNHNNNNNSNNNNNNNNNEGTPSRHLQCIPCNECIGVEALREGEKYSQKGRPETSKRRRSAEAVFLTAKASAVILSQTLSVDTRLWHGSAIQ